MDEVVLHFAIKCIYFFIDILQQNINSERWGLTKKYLGETLLSFYIEFHKIPHYEKLFWSVEY